MLRKASLWRSIIDFLCRKKDVTLQEIRRLEKRNRIKKLIKILNGESYNRYCAAAALGRLKATRAIEPLIATLGDENIAVRREAAAALGTLKATCAIDPLIAALEDESIDVRASAAGALKKLGWKPEGESLSLAYHAVRCDVAELVKIGRTAIEPMEAVLLDRRRTADDRYRATQVLDKLQWKPKDEALKVAYFMARMDTEELVKIGEASVEWLKHSFGYFNLDRDKDKREKLWAALCEIASPSSLDHLISTLRSPYCTESIEIQKAMIETIGKIGDEKVIPSLFDLSKSRNGHLYWDTVYLSIAQIIKRCGLNAFKVVLFDERFWGWEGWDLLRYPAHTSTREAFVDAFASLGTQAIEPLTLLMKDTTNPCYVVRYLAAYAIGCIGDIKARDDLIHFMEEDWHAELVEVLGNFKDARVVETLIEILGGKGDFDRKSTAVVSLGKIGDPIAVNNLIELLKPDPNPSYLEGYGNPLRLRSVAAQALGKIRDSRAVLPLCEALSDQTMVTFSTSSNDPQWHEGCTDRVVDGYQPTRIYAAIALGEIGDRRAKDALESASKHDRDEAVRKHTAQALSRII